MGTKKRTCGACGGLVQRFTDEAFTLAHRGASVTVAGLSGRRCASCAEVEFDADSAARYAAAGDALVMEERQREAAEIRRIRTALKLTQVEAARLTGGGPNAFSRYERGEARPLPAVLNLLRLLERHPELLREIA